MSVHRFLQYFTIHHYKTSKTDMHHFTQKPPVKTIALTYRTYSMWYNPYTWYYLPGCWYSILPCYPEVLIPHSPCFCPAVFGGGWAWWRCRPRTCGKPAARCSSRRREKRCIRWWESGEWWLSTSSGRCGTSTGDTVMQIKMVLRYRSQTVYSIICGLRQFTWQTQQTNATRNATTFHKLS